MPVHQVNIFICEKCGRVKNETILDIGLYSDPVVSPEGPEWDYVELDSGCILHCDRCLLKLAKDKHVL